MSTLLGSSDSDILYAGTQGDVVVGGGGADALVGGVGSDTLVGEDGFDYFIFQKEYVTVGKNGATIVKGGYGGNDFIADFLAEAGIGDVLKLRNLDNGVGINVRDDGQGGTLITLFDRNAIDPNGGASGTGNFTARLLQTITVQNVSARQLMTQGALEINGVPFNETTEGLVKAFGTYDLTIGAQSATFPTRPGGSAGNTVVGDPAFGQPGIAPENNLMVGDFVSSEKVASVLQAIVDAVTDLTIPGTEAAIPADLREVLEAKKVIGKIPDSLLPRHAFAFALDASGQVDLSRFTRTFDATTVNDDVLVGGPGNDVLIGGPGNDILVGNQGVDILWAGTGQDIIVGREGVDYIIFDSILEIRDRDNIPEDPLSNAIPDARTGYIRYEEPYGVDLTDPFTTRTGPDIILVNAKAFNRGIDPDTNPELAAQIGYLKPGTFISGDGSGTAATKNGQLNVGVGTVPVTDGPAADDVQPTFYYSPIAGRLFFDRDGSGTGFFDFWMTDMGTAGLAEVELPAGTPSAAPAISIYIY